MDFCAVGVSAQAEQRCDHSRALRKTLISILRGGAIDRPSSPASVCRLQFKCDATQRWKLPVFFSMAHRMVAACGFNGVSTAH